MEKMLQYCRDRGTKKITGQVLMDNTAMLHMVRKFQFNTQASVEEQGVVTISLDLTAE